MHDRSPTRKRSLFKQRPELVNRFVRIYMIRKGREIGQIVARRRARRTMLKVERPRSKALKDALEVCGREAMRARRNRLPATETVLNLALYFLMAERDIQAVKIDALTHPNPWTRSLCARVILLTIHELELDKAAGSKLRQALDDTNVSAELQREVTQALRLIRAAQKKAQKQFSQLRDSIIAHRDSDAVAQYRRISELDSLSIMTTAAEFYAGTKAFMDVMPRLIMHVGGLGGMISQLVLKIEVPTL